MNNLLYYSVVLQSSVTEELLKDQEIRVDDLSSFVFIEKEKIYTRSTAALRVCRYLGDLWPLMFGFMVIPKFVRDGIYKWIVKNRYRWFGKKDECMISTQKSKPGFN